MYSDHSPVIDLIFECSFASGRSSRSMAMVFREDCCKAGVYRIRDPRLASLHRFPLPCQFREWLPLVCTRLPELSVPPGQRGRGVSIHPVGFHAAQVLLFPAGRTSPRIHCDYFVSFLLQEMRKRDVVTPGRIDVDAYCAAERTR